MLWIRAALIGLGLSVLVNQFNLAVWANEDLPTDFALNSYVTKRLNPIILHSLNFSTYELVENLDNLELDETINESKQLGKLMIQEIAQSLSSPPRSCDYVDIAILLRGIERLLEMLHICKVSECDVTELAKRRSFGMTDYLQLVDATYACNYL